MNQPDQPIPRLSVVLATRDDLGSLRTTLAALARQTILTDLEIVVVLPRASVPVPAGLIPAGMRTTLVAVDRVTDVGTANAAGVRGAAAAIVALAEDHCFPDSDWAERLVMAHREGWTAVGPSVRNANPDTVVSWADLFIGYGPWLDPAPSRQADFLPGHNTSYKKDVLIGYGDRLPEMLASETILHWDLRAREHRLFFDASARVSHTNFSLWSTWIPIQFQCGRSFAASRRLEMPAWKRLVYICGAPLIPLVRLVRLASGLPSPALRTRFLRTLPVTFLGLLLDGLGQMIGYAVGPGRSRERLAQVEFRRIDYVTAADRRMVFGE